VAVRLGTKHNERSHLLIEVEDSGPGIAAQDQPHIFEPFVQLGEQGNSKGTGLGLTITRQFVQLMGGGISLESMPGKGSLFRVELPLSEARADDIVQSKSEAQGEVVGLAPGQPPFRILIVEDQPDNQALLVQLMQNAGLQAKSAENGEQAVELFQSWQPQLILMDRRMPVMDGVEAARHIRELAGGKAVKIVAVTASAFKEEQGKMFDAGMDDFIGKPYRPGEIYACLAKQLGIRFLYQDTTETPQQERILTPEMLSVLPEPLRNELQEAFENLQNERIDQLIRQVATYDQDLQKTLTYFAESFDYPTILQALKSD
jgi:CheY-like chemotaxis protein